VGHVVEDRTIDRCIPRSNKNAVEWDSAVRMTVPVSLEEFDQVADEYAELLSQNLSANAGSRRTAGQSTVEILFMSATETAGGLVVQFFAVIVSAGGARSYVGQQILLDSVSGLQSALAQLLGVPSVGTAEPAPAMPVESSSSSSSSAGVIAGAVVGGIVFVALIALIAGLYMKRQRQMSRRPSLALEDELHTDMSMSSGASSKGLDEDLCDFTKAERDVPNPIFSPEDGDEDVKHQSTETKGKIRRWFSNKSVVSQSL
jgi:hypothetical protein